MMGGVIVKKTLSIIACLAALGCASPAPIELPSNVKVKRLDGGYENYVIDEVVFLFL